MTLRVVERVWTDSELAYLAGILDGEGCFTLSRGANGGYSNGTIVFVGNTDERLIYWLHSRFGGSIGLRPRQHAKHKRLWTWVVSGSAIEPIVQAVLPHLRLKQAQAALLLEYRKTVKPKNSRKGRTALDLEVQAHRVHLKSNLQLLNKRGA